MLKQMDRKLETRDYELQALNKRVFEMDETLSDYSNNNKTPPKK